jgi:hypothetical protein
MLRVDRYLKVVERKFAMEKLFSESRIYKCNYGLSVFRRYCVSLRIAVIALSLLVQGCTNSSFVIRPLYNRIGDRMNDEQLNFMEARFERQHKKGRHLYASSTPRKENRAAFALSYKIGRQTRL